MLMKFSTLIQQRLPGNNWRRQSMMIKVEDTKEDTIQRNYIT